MNDPADVHPHRPGRARQLASALGPVGVLGGMAGVGALTFALVTVEAGEQLNAAFVASVDYVLWRFLIVLLVLTSLVAAFIVRPRFMELRRRYSGATLAPLALAYPLATLTTAALPWLTRRDLSVAWNTLTFRIGIVVAIVAVGIAPAVGTIWIIRGRVRELARPIIAAPDHHADVRIRELLTLRRTASTALGILAALISLTVVNTSQLRRTHLAAGARPEDWPVVGLLLYGAFFGGLLALLYVPLHTRWRDSAEALREVLYPIPSDGRPDAEWSDGRKRVSDLLLLDKGVSGALGTMVTVVSPFLVSLLGYFIPAPS